MQSSVSKEQTMLKFYHAPNSRSSTIAQAIEEMGVADQVDTQIVSVPRHDGSGGPDANNPHPDKKVPALEHNGTLITERAAILTYLSEVFPDAPSAIPPGHAQRGPFLTWLAFYVGVVEPAIMCDYCEVDHPAIMNLVLGLETVNDRLDTALSQQDYLLPSGFSSADLLFASPYFWMPDILPEAPSIRAWFERVKSRPAVTLIAARDNP